MRRVYLFTVWALLAMSLAALPASAAQRVHKQQQSVDWKKRDTAVYVVSTINLLRTATGRPLASVLRQQLNVAHYAVYADVSPDASDLYFVQLKQSDGTVVGALAYRLGWDKPRSLDPATQRLGVAAAPQDVVQDYKSDPKLYYASFSSTLPS